MKKKIALVFVALVMVVVASVGGTLAWLTASTGDVKNTFTTADINIELIETMNPDGTEAKDGVTDWSAQMIPGYTYHKNPKVTVKANSVDCYLFVKFEVTGTANALDYTSNLNKDNDWTQGTGEDGDGVPTNVWYRKVSASTSDQSWNLLKDDKVKISENLTKANMPEEGKIPKLTYTAYASQLNKNATETFSAKEAWENVAPKA